jgi:hypothetical protein
VDVLDSYEKNTVRIGVKATKLTAQTLSDIAAWLLKQLKNKILPDEIKGKTSIKKLMQKGDKLLGQDIKSPDLKELSHVLKRYNIGFAAIKHEGTDDYTLFFKARDQAQLSTGLDAYLAKSVSRNTPEQKRPEISKTFRDKAELDKDVPDDVSFAAPTRESVKEKPREPQPRSIPKELEEAKAISQAMQRAREAEREITRSRSRGRER